MAGQEVHPGVVVEGDETASCLVQAVGGRGLVAGPSLQRGQGQQVQAGRSKTEGNKRQLAPLPQDPPRAIVLAGVEQDQAEVQQRTPASWPVLHLLEEQERLPQRQSACPKFPAAFGVRAGHTVVADPRRSPRAASMPGSVQRNSRAWDNWPARGGAGWPRWGKQGQALAVQVVQAELESR